MDDASQPLGQDCTDGVMQELLSRDVRTGDLTHSVKIFGHLSSKSIQFTHYMLETEPGGKTLAANQMAIAHSHLLMWPNVEGALLTLNKISNLFTKDIISFKGSLPQNCNNGVQPSGRGTTLFTGKP